MFQHAQQALVSLRLIHHTSCLRNCRELTVPEGLETSHTLKRRVLAPNHVSEGTIKEMEPPASTDSSSDCLCLPGAPGSHRVLANCGFPSFGEKSLAFSDGSFLPHKAYRQNPAKYRQRHHPQSSEV